MRRKCSFGFKGQGKERIYSLFMNCFGDFQSTNTGLRGNYTYKTKLEHVCAQPSGVASAFPGGRAAHPEGQNEDENGESLRKNKSN